ncbi:MAG: hypothetical protein NXI31_15625 [bacterium]|nr:hypothetical protein [bacterium]
MVDRNDSETNADHRSPPPGIEHWAPSHDDRDAGHPFRWRTWLRGRLPWLLINLGVAAKGRDCIAAGGWHRWYNHDDKSSHCYHCDVGRPERLWER